MILQEIRPSFLSLCKVCLNFMSFSFFDERNEKCQWKNQKEIAKRDCLAQDRGEK